MLFFGHFLLITPKAFLLCRVHTLWRRRDTHVPTHTRHGIPTNSPAFGDIIVYIATSRYPDNIRALKRFKRIKWSVQLNANVFKVFLSFLSLFFLPTLSSSYYITKGWIKYKECTWHTGAFIAGLSFLDARSSIMAGRRVAGQVPTLAVLACVLRRALAPVATNVVDAHAVVLAGRRAHVALVDILLAGLSREEGRAGADKVGLDGRAVATIGTGIWGTGISLLAQFSWGHRKKNTQLLCSSPF